MAHFQIPLNLPHAARVSARIDHFVRREANEKKLSAGELLAACNELMELLLPYNLADDNPPAEEAARCVAEAAALVRKIVAAIEAFGIGHDRLGQAVRNFFECLELGEEGAEISLRAGENPDSTLRAV